MRQDDRSGVASQGLLDDLAGMDAGAVDGAAEQLVEGYQAVAIIEVQTAKQFVRLVAEPRDEEAVRGGRGIEQRAAAQGFGIVAAGQFERRLQPAITRYAQPRGGQERRAVGAQQFAERVMGGEQPPGEVDHVAAAQPRAAEQQSQQFRVGKLLGPGGQQSLARPFLGGPLLQIHVMWVTAAPELAAAHSRLIWH